MSPGIMTGVGGASLDWDRRRRVTPAQTASQEAWPEAESLGWNIPLGESRGGTPTGERAAISARRAPQGAAVGLRICRRSASLLLLMKGRKAKRIAKWRVANKEFSIRQSPFAIRDQQKLRRKCVARTLPFSAPARSAGEGASDSTLRCRCRNFCSQEIRSRRECLRIALPPAPPPPPASRCARWRVVPLARSAVEERTRYSSPTSSRRRRSSAAA
jgi:hypothetical protein